MTHYVDQKLKKFPLKFESAILSEILKFLKSAKVIWLLCFTVAEPQPSDWLDSVVVVWGAGSFMTASLNFYGQVTSSYCSLNRQAAKFVRNDLLYGSISL